MALKKLLGGIVVLGAIGAGAFLFLTAPERLPAEAWARRRARRILRMASASSMRAAVRAVMAAPGRGG